VDESNIKGTIADEYMLHTYSSIETSLSIFQNMHLKNTNIEYLKSKKQSSSFTKNIYKDRQKYNYINNVCVYYVINKICKVKDLIKGSTFAVWSERKLKANDNKY